MKKILIMVLAIGALTSCGSKATKKVLVLGRGEITINENTVSMKDGPGHAEKLMEIDEDVTEIAVSAGSGKTTKNIAAEGGFYVLNLKKDTIVGSLQDLGNALNRRDVITQEALSIMIDSMQQLITGANITPGRNMIVLPQQLEKVSSNDDARVYGPFNQIPSKLDPAKNDKPLEIYKLWTNTQMRERIANFKSATVDLDEE